MTLKIGHLNFDHATYDEQGDVLYLHVGEPQAAAESEETRRVTSCASAPTVG